MAAVARSRFEQWQNETTSLCFTLVLKARKQDVMSCSWCYSVINQDNFSWIVFISLCSVKCWSSAFFQLFPRWLAPNVLTFTGWSLLFMIYAVTCYYDPHFTAAADADTSKRIPSWWWLIFAVAQFLAHTFDGCDGKQARRTNSR